MGYKAKVSAITARVDLSEGYGATVRLLAKQDEDACQAALLGGARTTGQYVAEDGGKGRTTLDQSLNNAAYTRELLTRGIASWDLDDEAGALLPIDATTVELLSGRDANALVKAIKDLNTPPDKSPAPTA